MPTGLVHESKNGAYLGATQEFLSKFELIENNPNFDVFYSKEGDKSFIVGKCSRLPDDEDLAKGRYGIDFHRAKPSFKQAQAYSKELPDALEKREYLGNIAFASKSLEEYEQKSWAYDNFYSYIFGFSPREVWVTPHSGDIKREPDELLPYPKLEIDAFTANVAALCAMKDAQKPRGRRMISVHGNGYLGAIIDLGGFGILDDEKLRSVANKIEEKYHEKAQLHASEYKKDFFDKVVRRLQCMLHTKGTLNPRAQNLSTADKHDINLILRGLELYGQKIKSHSSEEFEKAMENLNKIDLKAIAANFIYQARHVGKLLKLQERIKYGVLNSAIQIECSKLYLEKEPELLSEIILDSLDEYF